MELPGAWLLLAPAGLLGLLALAIPIAIHLISYGRGRRVLIGNIELVRAPLKARVSSIKLTQWLLLLLRLLIITVASLILAELARQGFGSADAGVRYVTPARLASATPAERDELDAVEPAVRVLTAKFPEAREFTEDDPTTNYDAWPLLAERLSTLRHSGTVTVSAANRMAEFGHTRPDLPNPLDWDLTAAAGAPDVIKSNGILVYDPDRIDDLSRVERALGALQRFRVPLLEWTSCPVRDTACREASADWLVWVSDIEPPADRPVRLHLPLRAEATTALSDPRYPDKLLESILDEEQRRIAWQRIPTSPEVLTAGAGESSDVQLPNRSFQHWLGLLLIGLWALERWLSERRRSDND